MLLRRLPRSIPAILLILSSACAPAAPAVVRDPAPVAQAAPGASVWIRDELYFGRRMADGRIVSEEEWRAFVDSVVTPRFPSGLTVLDAYGQWMDDEKGLIREPTKILVLLHPGGADPERAIREIITLYKQRFAQQSVLRVTAKARVEF